MGFKKKEQSCNKNSKMVEKYDKEYKIKIKKIEKI